MSLRLGDQALKILQTLLIEVAAFRVAVAFHGDDVIELAHAGVTLVGFRAYRDHRPYTPTELAELARTAREAGAVLVTTEKDLSRMLPLGAGIEPDRLLVLRIEAAIADERALLEPVLAAARGAGR